MALSENCQRRRVFQIIRRCPQGFRIIPDGRQGLSVAHLAKKSSDQSRLVVVVNRQSIVPRFLADGTYATLGLQELVVLTLFQPVGCTYPVLVSCLRPNPPSAGFAGSPSLRGKEPFRSIPAAFHALPVPLTWQPIQLPSRDQKAAIRDTHTGEIHVKLDIVIGRRIGDSVAVLDNGDTHLVLTKRLFHIVRGPPESED